MHFLTTVVVQSTSHSRHTTLFSSSHTNDVVSNNCPCQHVLMPHIIKACLTHQVQHIHATQVLKCCVLTSCDTLNRLAQSLFVCNNHIKSMSLISSKHTWDLFQHQCSPLDIVSHNRSWPCDTDPEHSFLCHCSCCITATIVPSMIQGCMSNSRQLES